MAEENCEVEVNPEANGVSQVKLRIGNQDDQRWSEIISFCIAPEAPGEFSFDMLDQHSHYDVIMFFFTDPNVAFEFKMRFA